MALKMPRLSSHMTHASYYKPVARHEPCLLIEKQSRVCSMAVAVPLHRHVRSSMSC